MRTFIKEDQHKKKAVIIVPIGNKYFNKEKVSYLKTIDYRLDFNPSKMGFEKFIQAVFDDNHLGQKFFKEQMSYLFKLLVREKKKTIREIKHILRLADLRFQKLTNDEKHKVDVRVFILFEVVNYIEGEVHHLINDVQRLKDDFWGKQLLVMIANDLNEGSFRSELFKSDVPFFLTGDSYIPQFRKNVFEHEISGYYMTNKYIEMFE